MKVVTRFAPTCSGDLHIGGLYNAFLNYLFAKKHGGEFKLRLDRIHLDDREKSYQKNIEEDLSTFGLYPDQVLKASERKEIYIEQVKKLVQHERSYACYCTAQDLIRRAHRDDSGFYHIVRREKYPPHCTVVQIQILDWDGNNVASDCNVYANHESRQHRACNVVNRVPRSNEYWVAYDTGYQGEMTPELIVDLGKERHIRAIEIVWKDRPVTKYEVYVKEEEWRLVTSKCSPNKYFIENKPGLSFPSMTSDRLNFAATTARYVKIVFSELTDQVDRPYFYDYHCRDCNHDSDLNDRDLVLRLKYGGPFRVHDFVRDCYDGIVWPEPDTAYWYGREPNLVLTSVIDDRELEVTHLIRGRDIYPFLLIEGQVALALNNLIEEQVYHGLVIDKRQYKYSKWIESAPVRDYLSDRITPNKIICFLAYKMGILESLKEVNLDKLIERFNPKMHMTAKDIVVDEQEMLESINKM